MRKSVVTASLIALMFVIVACAGSQIPDTPAGHYLLARTQFNQLLESYLYHKEAMPLDEQAAMSAKFKPYFKTASDALDAWGTAIDDNASTKDLELDFFRAKRSLEQLLISVGVEIKEG